MQSANEAEKIAESSLTSYGKVRESEYQTLLKLKPLLVRALIILEADDKVHADIMEDVIADIEPVTQELRDLLGLTGYVNTNGVHPNKKVNKP